MKDFQNAKFFSPLFWQL